MSLHKLTAGSGYDYLTRQVAALDATEKGHTGLADYYTAKGETPSTNPVKELRRRPFHFGCDPYYSAMHD
jgi:hypothetical protein